MFLFLSVPIARQEALSATKEKLALVESRAQAMQVELDSTRKENAKLLQRCADLEAAPRQDRALAEIKSRHAGELAELNQSCASLRAQVLAPASPSWLQS